MIVIVLWNYAIGTWVHMGIPADMPDSTTQLYNLLWAFTALLGGVCKSRSPRSPTCVAGPDRYIVSHPTPPQPPPLIPIPVIIVIHNPHPIPSLLPAPCSVSSHPATSLSLCSGAIIVVAMEAMEQELNKSQEKQKKDLQEKGLPLPTKSWQQMVIEFSNLIQSIFGSVAGNAFSAVLFFYAPSLSAVPTGIVPFQNLAIITIVTSLVCVWLVVSTSTKGVEVPENETEEEQKAREEKEATSRETHERAFLNGALSFLVLGGWTSVVQNSFAWFCVLVEMMVGEGQTADLIAVFIYAPLFTFLSFTAAEFVMSKMAERADMEKPKGSLVAHEKEAKESKAEVKAMERDPAAEKLARRKLLVDTSLIALLLGGKFSLAKELMDYKLENGGVKLVADFLEGAAVFVLSRMWSDLISAFLFGLHAIPYCGGFVATACAVEASSYDQFIYAACAVPVAGFIKNLVETTGITRLPGMYDDIPMILKYIVGWAFGNACQQWLVETKAANPGLCDGDDCTLVNVGFATAMTVFSAMVVLILKPFADRIEWGDGACTNFFEDLLEDVIQMVIRGLEVVSMVLWYYTAYNLTHTEYTSPFQTHMDLFWAFAMTFVGALVMVLLESMEQSVKKIKAAELISADAPHWSDAVVQLSDVVQNVFGFVTGCAWSDWLFETATSLGKQPTWDVILTNLLLVCVITILSCYWLIMNASSDGLEDSLTMTEEEKRKKAEAKATDRGEVEKAFFSGALGFFVLGGWLVVVRNLFAPFMVAIEHLIEYEDEHAGFSVPTKTGDTVAVLLFAPFFTIVSFSMAGKVMTSLTKKAGLTEAPKGKTAAAAQAHKKHADERRTSVDQTYSKNYTPRGSSKSLV